MAKTLFGSLGRAAATFANKTPISFAPPGSGRRSGFASGLTRPAGQTAQMRAQGSNSTLYAIVDRIITSYSQVEWHLYRKAKSGRDGDRVEVMTHAALDLWNDPNKFMTGPMFRESGQQHEELTGEQWWVIGRHPQFKKLPLELWPVRPDRMDPIPDAEDFIVGYVYRSPDGEQVPLDVEDVIFQRRPNPIDPYRGVGVVQTILVDLDATRASAEWNRAFFLNSAEPGGIVQVEKRLTDDEFNEFRDRWAEQHRGVSNAHRVGVLENGLTWVDRKYSMRDMQFTELRDVAREIIREAFGMPKPMLGAVDDVNRANAEAAGFVFAEWLIKPRLRRVKEILNTRLLPMYGRLGEGLEFDFDDPTPENREQDSNDLTARTAAAAALVQSGFEPAGTLSAVGLPEIPYSGLTVTPSAPGAAAPPSGPAALHTVERIALPPADTWDMLTAGLTNAQDAGSDLEQVRADQADALAQLLDRWIPIEDAWITALGEQIRTAVDDGDTAGLATLTVDSDKASAVLREALGSMAQRAASRMVDEAAAQGVTVEAPATDPALANHVGGLGALRAVFGAELVDIASATAALLASGLAATAGREALRLLTPGADGAGVANKVKGALRSLSNRLKLDQLGGALHRATNLGRVATLEAAPVATYTASEAMDTNTCTPCKDIDGAVFADLDAVRAAYGAGPYLRCEGGVRCRGTVVARWGS